MRRDLGGLMPALFRVDCGRQAGQVTKTPEFVSLCGVVGILTTKGNTVSDAQLMTLAANVIRGLAADGVQAANSGHPGMPMGMADAALVLWTKFLRFDPQDPDWPNRDRFVLSAGHGSMLLYTMLHLTGYDVSLDDLRSFRQ